MPDQPATIDALMADMTLDEKASLTAGVSLWYLPPVERLGIPALKVSDGPSGVRGDGLIGKRSLSFPCGMAVGSTWNTELVSRLGDVLAAEAASKNVHVLLGPTVCIVRTPLAGRTFESFSEDPHLTARLAVAYVGGVQRGGVACCIKHFACNDQEHERMSISAVVDEVALHEVHLPAFEAAVSEARVWALMTAYNRVNGVYCGEQPDLIGRVLRGHWDFDGLVMSDWFGTHSTVAAALAGLDLEMPGPSAWLGPSLAAAVRSGDVPESVVDGQVRHVLTLMERVGILGSGPGPGAGVGGGAGAGVGGVPSSEASVDEDWRRAVARQVAVEGAVLLSNDGVLPLDPAALAGRTVAVIGPNARMLEMGGGSSEVTPHRRRRVVDALAERLPGASVVFEEGCRIDKVVPTVDVRLFEDETLRVEYFDNAERTGEPVAVEEGHTGRMTWVDVPRVLDGLVAPGGGYSIRVSGTLRPDVSGEWTLGLESAGRSVLRVDGEVVVDNTEPERGSGFYGAGSTLVTAGLALEEGRSYEVVLEVWRHQSGRALLGLRLAAGRPVVDDAFDRAVAVAAEAAVAVVVVGLNGSWESEGFDRPDLSLAGEQARLVEAVAAVNPRTVLVINAGSPVDLPEGAAAALMCWYAGEEGADALADIVVGRADPGGRLPLTWPRSAEDGPTGGSPRRYPGVEGEVVYEEGVLVGYRHYATAGVEPRYHFGHGLSYGQTSYDEVRIGREGVSVDLTNTGDRTATEVVQVYVRGERLPIRLAGFVKVALDSGQHATVDVELTAASLRCWDTDRHEWRTAPGTYEVLVGRSAGAIEAVGEVVV
jgi:beta-glucosidase